MNQKAKKTSIVSLVVVSVMLAVFVWQKIYQTAAPFSVPSTTWNGESSAYNLVWRLPDETLSLIIASTSDEQELGLGDRASLASTTGMLFIFDSPGNYGFWMKDMEFPLDIIWLDRDFNIIYIEQNLSPLTYPEVFYPSSPAKYVIEVNAGLVKKFNIAIGQVAQIYQR